MKIIYLRNISDINFAVDNLSLVLGYFDGVHVGHSQLISFARANCSGPLGVLTFDKPLKSIEGSITSITLKANCLERLGVDYLFILVSDDNLKKMSYVEFVSLILKKINPIRLFCGPDFKFGYMAQGDVNYLKARFSEVYVLDYVKDHNGNKISSSKIKDLIKEGEIEEASRWLGRPYIMTGSIAHGDARGSQIGFPTANLNLDWDYVYPKNGVYVTNVRFNNKLYKSITNIGTHPTVDELLTPIIETYILDYEGDIYGENISLYIYKKIRDEIKFKNVDELKEQIAKDEEQAINYFKYKKLK